MLAFSRACVPPYRDEILGTTLKDFRAFADVLAAVRDKGQVVAVTSGAPIQRTWLQLGWTS